MRLITSRADAVWTAALAGILSFISGLIFATVRSDFIQRGCHALSSEQWKYTANCEDAYGAMRATGIFAVLTLGVLVWAIWRARHV
jgi:hypothetical protein